MTSKQERLKEVYNHLRSYFGIHTQIDFAESIRITRPALSSAMNGNEAYLTKNLFQKICAAYPDVFNLDYLLTGEGQLLTIEEEVKDKDIENLYKPQPIDNSSLVNAIIAAKDETIESLKSRIADLQRTIADKEEIIKAREARIVALERQLASASMSDIERYPFTIGAAEDINEPKTP